MKEGKSKFLSSLFYELNTLNVPYFVYGEYDSLPCDTGGSDIDMIIPHEEFERGISVLRDVSDKQNVDVVSYYNGPHSCFVRFMTPNWGVQFDIITGFYHKDSIYYPLDFLKDDIILHNQIVKVLKKEVGYYVDFLKELTHIETIKDKYVEGFFNEYHVHSYRKEQLFSLYGESFVSIIDKQNNVDEFKRNLSEIRLIINKKLHPYYSFGRLLLRIYSFKRMFCPPGYVVAIVGTDGSGKSTIINAITPILNEAFHKGVYYHHLRPHWIPDLGVALRQRKKNEEERTVENPHGANPSGFWGSLCRWGYYLIDYSIGYILKIWLSKHTKSHVHIFDRYYYDYYIDPYRLRVTLPQWIIRFGELFVPSPDIIICLGGDPKRIYMRKPETSFEEVVCQNERIKNLCKRKKKAVWINTTQDLALSINETMTVIQKMMADRFDKVIIR